MAVPAPAARQARVGPHGQHCGCLVHQPAGRSMITPHVTARPPSRPLESDAAQIAVCRPHSRGAQSCSRRAHDSSLSLENGDSIPRQSGWSGVDSGKLRWTYLLPTSPPTASCITPWPRPPSARTRWHTAVLGLYASMRFPSKPPRTDIVQGQGGRGAGLVGCAFLAHQDLVSRTHAPRDSPSLAHPPETGPSLSGAQHHLADFAGLSPAVVNTITQARASSTRQAYALKWSLFANWWSSRWEDPWRCPISVVLSFLQERLARRLCKNCYFSLPNGLKYKFKSQ